MATLTIPNVPDETNRRLRIRAAGLGFDTFDIQTAAIARPNGFAVATPDIWHFARCEVELINPFAP